MTETQKLLYTGRVHTTGGREGASRSDDGRLDVRLTTPGLHGAGTNPEQLFAAGWSACFESAIRLAAKERRIVLPSGTAVDAEVDLNTDEGQYFLSARLAVNIPGVERNVAEALVHQAHATCPYSKATRGNIDVVTRVA